jgi:hypothetical protein
MVPWPAPGDAACAASRLCLTARRFPELRSSRPGDRAQGYTVGGCHDATFSRLQRPCRASDGACGPHSIETCKIGERMHLARRCANGVPCSPCTVLHLQQKLYLTLTFYFGLVLEPDRDARAPAHGWRSPARVLRQRPTRTRAKRGVHDVGCGWMGQRATAWLDLGDPRLCALPLSCLQLLLHVHLCGCPRACSAGCMPLLIAPRSPRVLHDAPPE